MITFRPTEFIFAGNKNLQPDARKSFYLCSLIIEQMTLVYSPSLISKFPICADILHLKTYFHAQRGMNDSMLSPQVVAGSKYFLLENSKYGGSLEFVHRQNLHASTDRESPLVDITREVYTSLDITFQRAHHFIKHGLTLKNVRIGFWRSL